MDYRVFVLRVDTEENIASQFSDFGGLSRLVRRDGQDLVAPVDVVSTPGPIGDQVVLDQPVASIPEFVAIEAWDSPFDAIEPPARQTIAIGGQDQEQVQGEVGGLEALQPPVGAQSMIEPSKGLGHAAATLGDEDRQFSLEGHKAPFARGTWTVWCRLDATERRYRQTPTPTRPTGQVHLTKRLHFLEKSRRTSRRAWENKIQTPEVEDN